jgi:hypothetical protein
MTIPQYRSQYQSPYIGKSNGDPASALVTALIRYIYKGACKLLSGQATSLIRPGDQSSKSSHDLQPQELPVRFLSIVFISFLLESKGCPSLDNLVGLLGGLEGRVAWVVLELVGCGGTSLVSNLGESARWV